MGKFCFEGGVTKMSNCIKLVTLLDLEGDLVSSSREDVTNTLHQEISKLGIHQTIKQSGKLIKFSIRETENGWVQTSLVANY